MTQNAREYKRAQFERIDIGFRVVIKIPGASEYLGHEARLEASVKANSVLPVRLTGSNISSQTIVFINLGRYGVVELRNACDEWIEYERKAIGRTLDSPIEEGVREEIRISGASEYLGCKARFCVSVKNDSFLLIYLTGSNIDPKQTPIPDFIILDREGAVALRNACNEWIDNERITTERTLNSLTKRLRN